MGQGPEQPDPVVDTNEGIFYLARHLSVDGILAAGMLFAAKEHGFGPQRRFAFAASRLNLNDAQKVSAQGIFDQSLEAAKPLRAQLRQSHQELASAIQAG